MTHLAFAAILLCYAVPATAFGPLGHEIVAEIAARELSPAARAEVESLFGEPASNALREGSLWVHRVRALPGYGPTGPLHYVNFPRGECRYESARDCQNDRCVVGAIERFSAQLHAGGSAQQRAAALKWLVHLVADVHQPMHAAWGYDRGGNDTQVQFRYHGTNLHKLWDSGLLYQRRLRAVPYAERLLAASREPVDTRWSSAAPARWAEESCAIARDSAYPAGRRIDPTYVDRNLPLLERRMVEAGLRLAALLNEALGGR